MNRASVTLTGNYYFQQPNVLALHNGGATSDTYPGMTTTYTYTPISPDKSSYEFQTAIAQLVTKSIHVKLKDTQQILHLTLNGVAERVLDTFPAPASPNTSTTITAKDDPGGGVDFNPPIDNRKVTNETFDVWLMFRSLQPVPGKQIDLQDPTTISSRWGPLNHFTWTWSGEASLVNGQWINIPSSASAPQPSEDQPTAIQPQWTHNTGDLHFSP